MSRAIRPRYVLDASIAVKWYLPDEDLADEADDVLTAFLSAQIDLVAPDHIDYEMSNVLRTATLRKRVPSDLARDSLIEFLSPAIERVGGARLALEGYDLAQQFGCAAYDGLYLALATRLGIPLVHADDRLSQSLAGRFAHELHLSTYR